MHLSLHRFIYHHKCKTQLHQRQTVPVEDAAVADAERPPLTVAPASSSPLEDHEINVSSESRYPTRERRPPARMDL